MIRKVKKEDAYDLWYLTKQTAEESEFLSRVAGEYNGTIEENEVEILYAMQEKNFYMLVDIEEGHVVGALQLHRSSPRKKARHKVELGIKILEKYCNQGIGRKLMEAGIQKAKEEGYEMITLSCMKENTRAIHLYESLGFIQYGELERAYLLLDGRYQSEIYMVKYL